MARDIEERQRRLEERLLEADRIAAPLHARQTATELLAERGVIHPDTDEITEVTWQGDSLVIHIARTRFLEYALSQGARPLMAGDPAQEQDETFDETALQSFGAAIRVSVEDSAANGVRHITRITKEALNAAAIFLKSATDQIWDVVVPDTGLPATASSPLTHTFRQHRCVIKVQWTNDSLVVSWEDKGSGPFPDLLLLSELESSVPLVIVTTPPTATNRVSLQRKDLTFGFQERPWKLTLLKGR